MSSIAVVVCSDSVQESKLLWLPSGVSLTPETVGVPDATYIAVPKELVKEVTGDTVEEPYIYWQQSEQQETLNGNMVDGNIQETQFVDAAKFEEPEILCDEVTQTEWNDGLTTQLIQTRTSMAHEFSEPKRSKCKLWKCVAAKLNHIQGGEVSLIGPDCDRKWRNLVQTYKTIRERMDRTGCNAVAWKFYPLMAEVMKARSNEDEAVMDKMDLHLECTKTAVDETGFETVVMDVESSQLTWTDDLIRSLIGSRSVMAKHFAERRCSPNRLWRRIANEMNRVQGRKLPLLTGPDCDRKWRNLLQTFNKIRSRDASFERGTVKWKFYSLMLDALSSFTGVDVDSNHNDTKQTPWTNRLVRLLIETRASMSKNFELQTCSKSKLWQRIAVEINSVAGHLTPSVTGQDCDRKWRNLVQTFKVMRDRMRRSTGSPGFHWKFYSQMSDALNHGDTPDPCTSTGQDFRTLRNSESSNEAPEWFRRYVEERQAVENQRWEELKQMEMTKLAAIRELTDTIKQHLCTCSKAGS